LRGLGEILHQTEVFLLKDGKYNQAAELITRAVEVIEKMNDPSHLDTLTAKVNFVETY
jgi:hypothetical protein